MAKYNRGDLTGKTKLALKKICAEVGAKFEQTLGQPDIIDRIMAAQEGGGSAASRPSSASATPADARGSVHVSSGASSQDFNIAGMDVGSARQQLSAAMTIGREAEARVNGAAVPGSYVLKNNDSLEFVKKSGKKGC